MNFGVYNSKSNSSLTREVISFRLYDNKENLFLRWNKRHLSVYFAMPMIQLQS